MHRHARLISLCTFVFSLSALSLEQNDGAGIGAVQKTLLFNSDDHGGLMAKIEGMAWVGTDQWIMVYDNDFGIT